jgi:hypothetical protein
MVFNATSNTISVISWWSVLLVEKATDLSQVNLQNIRVHMTAAPHLVVKMSAKTG